MTDQEIIQKFGMNQIFIQNFNRWNNNQRDLFRKLILAVHNAGYDWYWIGNDGELPQLRIGFKNIPTDGKTRVIAVMPMGRSPIFKLRDFNQENLSQQHINLFIYRQVIQRIHEIQSAQGIPPKFNCPARIPPTSGHFPIEYDTDRNPTDPTDPTPPPLPAMILNTILFGPPGTGKTYCSTGKSLQLLGIQDDLENNHQKFSENCKKGNIVFTTFHQSYSYEDFIEGIRVNTNELKEVEYKIRNGIFKRIARKALFHKAAYAAGFSAASGIDRFADLYSETLDESLTSSSEILEKIEGARRILQKIEQWKSNPLDATVSDADEQVEKERVFVLIVDEINRGNISKIFGELITLIEDNKRLGKQDVLSVTLPYSGEQFFVPDNLYIVGTMNTADRSLAALDVALRRRFVFEEMMPDFGEASPISAVNVPAVNVRAWMIKVNQRIQAERGREFTIGHAFFMPLTVKPTMDELASIMKLKILPLLEEYFFDDWEGIRYVLGEKDEFSPNECLVKVTSVQSRNTKAIKIYGWNEEALIKPTAYR